MLEAYLDDSGTHNGSAVVVWGGVLGDKHFIDQLDRLWRKKLENPCEGRPPIKKFHSHDLKRGFGEFFGYSQGERDLTRRNFRQAIIESQVSIIAYGAPLHHWEQIIHKIYRQYWFTAEQAVFGRAVKEIAQAAKIGREPVNLHFDRGRHSAGIDKALNAILDDNENKELLAKYAFSDVGSIPSLQAADLVAHECYQHFVDRLKDRKATLNAHTQKLFDGVFDGAGAWLSRKAIKRAAIKSRSNRRTRL